MSCEFVNQTIRFAMIHVTRGWLYKLTREVAWRTQHQPRPGCGSTPCLKPLFSHAGKKLSLTLLMFAPHLSVLMFLRLKPATFCLMDNRDCPVNIVGTAFSLLPDPH
jgi:hypothetical protein